MPPSPTPANSSWANVRSPKTVHSTYNTGKTATGFYDLGKGLKRFAMTHQGERNFIVWLFDKNEARVNGGLLANGTGPYEGSRAIQVPKDDIYIL